MCFHFLPALVLSGHSVKTERGLNVLLMADRFYSLLKSQTCDPQMWVHCVRAGTLSKCFYYIFQERLWPLLSHHAATHHSCPASQQIVVGFYFLTPDGLEWHHRCEQNSKLQDKTRQHESTLTGQLWQLRFLLLNFRISAWNTTILNRQSTLEMLHRGEKKHGGRQNSLLWRKGGSPD